jgi:pimeloyl-ACP methyl ester carboxylesterase
MRIIFLHGINAQTTNYSEALYRRVLAACRAALTAAGHTQDQIDATLRRLVHHEIFWAELTTDLTNRYLDLAYEHPNFFWNILTNSVDPLGLQIMQYIKDKGDKTTGAMNILRAVDADFRRLFATPDVGEDNTSQAHQHAIIVAHSLGSVIAFDYIMGFRPSHSLSGGVIVDSFITMGSPREHLVRTRFLPIPAHSGYWTNDATAAIIAREVLLALGIGKR